MKNVEKCSKSEFAQKTFREDKGQRSFPNWSLGNRVKG